jgi:hypothetical protein
MPGGAARWRLEPRTFAGGRVFLVGPFVGRSNYAANIIYVINNLRGTIGGAEGNRTPDLLNAIQALSQLSYGPADLGGAL